MDTNKRILMKTKISFLIGGLILILSCCSNEERLTIPYLNTTDASCITEATAVSGGIISSDGGSDVVACGVCWSTAPNPTIVNSLTSDTTSTVEFVSKITGLKPSTTYYIRAYATNKVGTAYGLQDTLTTKSFTLTTIAPTIIMAQTASSGGVVSSDGDNLTVSAKGICWSTSVNPTVDLPTKTVSGSGAGPFISNITGLIANTTYFIRAYATNSVGTKYGNELSFTTAQIVTDLDGNMYNSVIIGTQIWMVENLKTTKYRDGSSILNVTDDAQWGNLSTGAYCDYNNIESHSTIYGRLYNWYAVSDSRNIAPAGWHVATVDEWAILSTYLGGKSVAGGKLKTTGTTYWFSPNWGATNESGFSALPSGCRNKYVGDFYGIGEDSYWWCTTEYSKPYAWVNFIENYSREIYSSDRSKTYGFSVRCLRDY